jgi:hypothetical protein
LLKLQAWSQSEQKQAFEHHHWVERRTATLRAIAIAKPFNQPCSGTLEIGRRLQNLERIGVLAQRLKLVSQSEQFLSIPSGTPRSLSINGSPSPHIRRQFLPASNWPIISSGLCLLPFSKAFTIQNNGELEPLTRLAGVSSFAPSPPWQRLAFLAN